MYIEVREKSGKYYVMIRHDDTEMKAVAQFASGDKAQAENVARQYARQNKCMIRFTSGGTETPEMPQPPTGEA